MRIRFITKINKQFIFTASFCLFLVLYIFNGYEFGAPFGQTILPISIVLVASLFTKHEHDYKYYSLIIILAILALISTVNSDVVNFSQSRVWTFVLGLVVLEFQRNIWRKYYHFIWICRL